MVLGHLYCNVCVWVSYYDTGLLLFNESYDIGHVDSFWCSTLK